MFVFHMFTLLNFPLPSEANCPSQWLNCNCLLEIPCDSSSSNNVKLYYIVAGSIGTVKVNFCFKFISPVADDFSASTFNNLTFYFQIMSFYLINTERYGISKVLIQSNIAIRIWFKLIAWIRFLNFSGLDSPTLHMMMIKWTIRPNDAESIIKDTVGNVCRSRTWVTREWPTKDRLYK
jgi:hypothetical protein